MKMYDGSLSLPHWHKLGKHDSIVRDDICLFHREAGNCVHPSSIASSSWDSWYGCTMHHYHGFLVEQLESLPVCSSNLSFSYAVYRKGERKRKREYRPSKWADPVPLP